MREAVKAQPLNDRRHSLPCARADRHADPIGDAVHHLEVRGDGRSYQARFRQDGRFDGVAWRAAFETTGSWQTVELAFSAFEPVFRGRSVRGAGPVSPARIEQVGFLLADKNAGEFELEVRRIEFLGPDDVTTS